MPNVQNFNCFETRTSRMAHETILFQFHCLITTKASVFETYGPVVCDLVQLHVDQLHSCCDPVPCFGPRTESARVSEKITLHGSVAVIKLCVLYFLSCMRQVFLQFFFFFVLGETRFTLGNYFFCRADHFISPLRQVSLKIQTCPWTTFLVVSTSWWQFAMACVRGSVSNFRLDDGHARFTRVIRCEYRDAVATTLHRTHLHWVVAIDNIIDSFFKSLSLE